MLPLFPILIPMALASFANPVPEPEPLVQAPSWLRKFPKALYTIGFVLFLVLTNGFAQYLEKTHVAQWRKKVRDADFALKQGVELYQKGKFDEAIRAWQIGLEANPESIDLHYNLGHIYAYRFKDRTRALAHWRRCLELDASPSQIKIEDVKAELERLEKTP